MESIPTSTIIIDNDSGVTLRNDEEMSVSLPDQDEIQNKMFLRFALNEYFTHLSKKS